MEVVQEPMAGSAARRVFYNEEEISKVPQTARNLARGCGNPTGFASLGPGEVVADLGCGGGVDVIIAAHKTAPDGRIVGVDLAAAMIAKARQAVDEAGLGDRDIDLLVGDVERLELPDVFADVVISNCVICMVPDKRAAYSEAFRILKPGGRLAIADLVLAGSVDPRVRERLRTAWQGALGGAIPRDEYLDIVREAGFERIEVVSCDALTAEEIAAVAICPGKAFTAAADEDDLARMTGRILSVKFLAFKPLAE